MWSILWRKLRVEDRSGREHRQADCRYASRPWARGGVYRAELDPGINDDAVLVKSRELHAVLVTADQDFGELIFRQRLLHSGVMLIRLAGLKAESKAALLATAVEEHADELHCGFAVLSKRALRLRKRPP